MVAVSVSIPPTAQYRGRYKRFCIIFIPILSSTIRMKKATAQLAEGEEAATSQARLGFNVLFIGHDWLLDPSSRPLAQYPGF